MAEYLWLPVPQISIWSPKYFWAKCIKDVSCSCLHRCKKKKCTSNDCMITKWIMNIFSPWKFIVFAWLPLSLLFASASTSVSSIQHLKLCVLTDSEKTFKLQNWNSMCYSVFFCPSLSPFPFLSVKALSALGSYDVWIEYIVTDHSQHVHSLIEYLRYSKWNPPFSLLYFLLGFILFSQ